MEMIKKNSLYLAWLIAIVGTLTSLYLSEIQGLPVCHLCWYQRICLYPLVIILAMAVYRREKIIASYCVPLTIIGALLALYQYLIQMIPQFEVIGVCGQGPSCSATHMKLYGFITLPLLAVFCFVILTVLLKLCHDHKA